MLIGLGGEGSVVIKGDRVVVGGGVDCVEMEYVFRVRYPTGLRLCISALKRE